MSDCTRPSKRVLSTSNDPIWNTRSLYPATEFGRRRRRRTGASGTTSLNAAARRQIPLDLEGWPGICGNLAN